MNKKQTNNNFETNRTTTIFSIDNICTLTAIISLFILTFVFTLPLVTLVGSKKAFDASRHKIDIGHGIAWVSLEKGDRLENGALLVSYNLSFNPEEDLPSLTKLGLFWAQTPLFRIPSFFVLLAFILFLRYRIKDRKVASIMNLLFIFFALTITVIFMYGLMLPHMTFIHD